MEALRLAAPTRVWERYQDASLGPGPEWADLRRVWARADRFGAPVNGAPPGDRVLTDNQLAAHRERCGRLLTEGARTIDHTARAFSTRDHVLLLADTSGVITYAAGGGGFEAEAHRLRLVPGAEWSERIRGTNAIGTVLEEGRAVSVIGAGHYGRRYHDLVCYAEPIVGPGGRVVGVLDATSYALNADETFATTVSAAARALEVVLRARAWAGAGAAARQVVERVMHRVPSFGAIVESNGTVVRCNPVAEVWLGASRSPVRVLSALGLTWEVLAQHALSGSGPICAGPPPRPLWLKVEPILDGNGSLLALALFEDVAGPSSRSAAGRDVPATGRAFQTVFAQDAAVKRAIRFAEKVSQSDLPVVLLSETGTGKELFANAIHQTSRRREQPFVAVNCGSLNPQLLESELFGYAPGAFTGASREGRMGLFHAADGGTLFFDEVADMTPAMQAAILRVLESGVYNRVGERQARHCDVRIVCATCRDLAALVASGDFRPDLYYRLKSVAVTVPPLRDRTDKLELATHLVGDAPPFSAALRSWIETYDWPGNVRELKSVLAVVHMLGADAPELDVEHLPPDLVPDAGIPSVAPQGASLAGVEVWAVKRALDQVGGNVSAAARRLGVARSTVYRILRREK